MYEFANADIRLVGSELANEGRLEVKVAGIWGTICGRGFDDVDAGVACYMLGFGYVRNVKRFDFLTNRKKIFGLLQRTKFDFRHDLVFAKM